MIYRGQSGNASAFKIRTTIASGNSGDTQQGKNKRIE
jgi:hypothetical protein